MLEAGIRGPVGPRCIPINGGAIEGGRWGGSRLECEGLCSFEQGKGSRRGVGGALVAGVVSSGGVSVGGGESTRSGVRNTLVQTRRTERRAHNCNNCNKKGEQRDLRCKRLKDDEVRFDQTAAW